MVISDLERATITEIVAADWICYKQAMDALFVMTALELARPGRTVSVARLTEPDSILLHDHTRLPGRFFGRMTASIQAELTS